MRSRRVLHAVARDSIEHGLRTGRSVELVLEEWPASLCEERASFVTLRIAGELRGCVGTLEAVRPLVVDVAVNAFGAAFRDPRFEPLSSHELRSLETHISILNAPEPVACDSEGELVAGLRQGVDGLILETGCHRATFLPTVWEQLPEPCDFLQALKRKAGLAPGAWSSDIRAMRYTTECVPDLDDEVS